MNKFVGSTYLQSQKKELGTLEVITFPYRKGIVLSIQKDGTSHRLGFFKDADCAREFIAWMDGLTDLVIDERI